MIITANEVKKNGVSIFDKYLDEDNEVVINFRGKNRYIVMDITRYDKFREYELDRAYEEVMEDYKNGDYHTDIDKHLKMIENV